VAKKAADKKKPSPRPLKSFRQRHVLLAMDLTSTGNRRTGIAQYAREAGWILDSRLIAFQVHGQHREYLQSAQIDGVISMTSALPADLLPIVRSLDVPIVELWHNDPEWKVPRVLLDHHAAGRMAADHLLGIGAKSLLFYSHTVDRRVALLRLEGFRAHAATFGVAVHELWWEPKVSAKHPGGRIRWLAEKLKALPGPLGVLAINDVVASEIIDAGRAAGLAVPDQLAVLGIDNDPIVCELGPTPISSIDIARERVGYEAAALLDRLMRGQKSPAEPVRVPPAGIVVRRSTDFIAVPDAEVASAARYIREHCRERINVSDVTANSSLSRRRLQDRFLAAMGHGINDEITRQRVQLGTQMLSETDYKISTVASMCGFAGAKRMSRVFQRVLGIAPGDYRRRYRRADAT